jgi:hypothetical protein
LSRILHATLHESQKKMFLVVLFFAVALGQRPGSGSTDPLCNWVKFVPSDAMFFSLFVEQTGEQFLCEPFLLGLAPVMVVEMEQLGAPFLFLERFLC